MENQSPVKVITGLAKPQAIAFTNKGKMIVTERNWRANKVTLRDKQGDVVTELNHPFFYPSGVAVDEDDNIYVTDSTKGLSKFDSHGSFLKSTDSNNGCIPGDFRKALGLVVVEDRVYVCDGPNHRIQVFCRHSLKFLATFGSRGDGPGSFNVPFDIATDRSGNLYVADHYNHRIQVFNSKLECMRTFGCEGDKPGQLHFPQVIALDPTNQFLYIGEGGRNCRISVYKTTGEFVSVIGAFTSGNGYAAGVAVDENGYVYVCDNGNNQISVLKTGVSDAL